jgi:hypothetical protein
LRLEIPLSTLDSELSMAEVCVVVSVVVVVVVPVATVGSGVAELVVFGLVRMS